MKGLTAICFLLSLSVNAQRLNLLAEYTFDSTIGNWFENSTTPTTFLSSYTKRGGKSALKVELLKGSSIRSELGTDPRQATKEVWVGYSLFFPSSFVKDASAESIQQWQAYPDTYLGETWRSAPLFLGVLNDRFILEVRTDTNKITIQPNYTFERIDLGAVVKSRWLDFVLHIKWSHLEDGLIEVWGNDTLILSKKGANCYNDKLYPYFKIGCYKWDWAGQSNSTTTKRTLYIDEVRIGNERAAYNDVYPFKKLVKTARYFNDGTVLID